ncbi:MAG: Hpt domain-containing protein [Phycisphaerales bacterium]|nr:Hpt domain-containing protein [Phycisphaerales bacterium]
MADHADQPLRSAFSDDPEMQHLLQLFVEELPQHIDELCEALNDESLDDAQRIAHQLKGAGAGYGFAPISEAASDLEAALTASVAEANAIRQALDALVDCCTRVIA